MTKKEIFGTTCTNWTIKTKSSHNKREKWWAGRINNVCRKQLRGWETYTFSHFKNLKAHSLTLLWKKTKVIFFCSVFLKIFAFFKFISCILVWCLLMFFSWQESHLGEHIHSHFCRKVKSFLKNLVLVWESFWICWLISTWKLKSFLGFCCCGRLSLFLSSSSLSFYHFSRFLFCFGLFCCFALLWWVDWVCFRWFCLGVLVFIPGAD